MTDAIESEATEPKPPAGHYYATVKDRRIVVKDINPAQSMILGGMKRQLRNGLTDNDSGLDMLGKMMFLFDALIPGQEDRDWLEERMISGEIDVEDFAAIFSGDPVKAEAKGAASKLKPRRGK